MMHHAENDDFNDDFDKIISNNIKFKKFTDVNLIKNLDDRVTS